MSAPNFVVDRALLWLEVPLSGSPGYWAPNTNYSVGDSILPRPSFIIPVGKENVMFQVVGFVGISGSVAPTFPTSIGSVVVDGNIEWICRDPNEVSIAVEWFEYYNINYTLTLA
jgi:hypothetical protein